MNDFKRAFAISAAVIFLLFFLVFSFELINRTVSKSGFSSGEVLVLKIEENVFWGEVLGRKFYFDFSPLINFLPRLGFLRFFVPPLIRLGVIFLRAVI